MSEMAETNKLLKTAVKNTYKKMTSMSKQHPKKTSNDLKTSKKVDKTVKFVDKSKKDSKDANKIPENKTIKNSNKKNATLHTVSEIQTSDPGQNAVTDENESDSTGWNSLPDTVMTSDSSDTSDTDVIE